MTSMRSLPPPPPPTAREQATPDLREATGILRRHRWVLLACPLIGIALGLGFASLRDPVYEASALIAMGEQQPGVTTIVNTGSLTEAQRIATEIQELQSRNLARAVVDSLGLQVEVVEPAGVPRSELIQRVSLPEAVMPASYRLSRQSDGRFRVQDEKSDSVLGTYAVGAPIPLGGSQIVLSPEAVGHEAIELSIHSRSDAVEAVETDLEVKQPSPEVRMVRVSYRASDPELARDVPNVLTARYMALREFNQKATARTAATFLRAQLDTVTRQLNMSQAQLRAFQERNRVIDPQLESSTQVTQLAQLRAQRGTLAAERDALTSVFNEVRRSAGAERPGVASPYRRLVGYPAFLQNEAATQLLSSLSVVENQRADLATRRTAEDPDLRALDARVAEIERQLQSMVSTYLQSITRQVAAMDAELGRSQAQLSQMPAKATEFARLSMEPQALAATYELLQTRLKEAEIAEAAQVNTVRVVDSADLPREPTGPGAPLFAGAGAAVVLLLGIGLVFAREYADQAVHTRADVQAAIGIPVLGMIPAAQPAMLQRRKLLPRPRNQSLSAETGGGSEPGRMVQPASGSVPALLIAPQRAPTPWSDAYTRLHTNIMFAQPDSEMKTVLFTSPLPGDGKTSTAANFAITLAQSGLKVLLIDADLRRGSVHELFETGPTPGLSDLLSEAPVPGVLRHADVGGGKPLRYIAAGRTPHNPVQLLSSTGMRALLECAEQEYDRVIIDTPPLNLFPDAVALSAWVDGVVVVARAGVTPFDALVDTAEQLRHANTRVVG
ncbi:MAG: polysaccharide biosynthesis tyrosine autokinase, partial [Gemmatimonadetes bacterium]|nr:polysaccharide biosynthesis tyrosine autokinase [Gemmatimonadota bacterium]